jgi:hypothetical protein
MKTEIIKAIIALNTQFSSASRVVADAKSKGEVENERVGIDNKNGAVTGSYRMSKTLDTSKDASEADKAHIASLRQAMKVVNAFHAFQVLAGLRIAQISEAAMVTLPLVEAANAQAAAAAEAAALVANTSKGAKVTA